MPTLQEEYDVLAGELQGLNARLGLPEDDGIPQVSPANSEYENLVQQNNALDQRLSALFPTFDEWNAEQDELDKRSNWEATKTFGSNFITGAGAMLDEGGKALDEITSGKAGWDSLGGIWEVGKRDFVRFAKTMGGAAEDWLPTTESERSREYRRAKENFDYYQTVRPLMVDAVGGNAKNLVSFGAQFVDPFMAIPVAGVAAKVGAVGLKSARLGRAAAALDKVGEVVSLPSKAVAAATRKGLKRTAYAAGKGAGLVGAAGGGVAKLAGLPRELTTKLAKKALPEAASEGAGGALFASQILGGASGMLPGAAELGIGEIAGFIASRTGKGLESVLTTLAAPGAQQRFLQRLAQTAESPRMRKLALWAHRKGGTKLGDVAFNSLVNGASIASINGALAYLSGESAEGIGQAAGAGMVMGGALPFGQPGQRAGKAQSSRDATSINYFEGKIAAEQVKEFRKLIPEARLVAATAEEAGIPIPKLFFVDSKTFLEIMRQDDPNAREAQSAMYDPKAKEIYVNQDISSKESSRAVMQMFTEELGHHFITEAIKTDPMFGHQILAEYKAKEGEKSHTFIFERDPDGNPLRTIEINEKGKKLADAYSSISDDVNVGIGNNANTLAQEIGAAQFSIMMDENPNLFPHLAQPIRHKLVNASQKILSLMGITDKFGNTLPLNIASKLKRSPAIRNLYRNYLKQREMHMAGKIDLAENGQSIPLKRGESPEAGAERLFGATGLSLKDAKSFVINNKQIKNELTKLKNRYQDEPADGWSVVRGRLIGKELTPDMRVIFTRTNPDPRGSVNIAINDIQAAIADNGEVNFLYRSGKPSKYSDNELKIRVVAPVGLEISGMAGEGTPGLYMQAMDIAYLKNNVEVLVQEGFIKDPDKFIAEARQVAKDAVSDPEGRINPEGKFENELITVALGNKASADFIKNPKLARLLEEGRLQHSFRQYHIGSLAGIALTGRPGIGFDWYNVKRNYSPHGRNFMPRRKPGQPDDTIPLPFDELPGDKPGEGFGRMVNVDKTKSELAEAKRLADEAQDGFSSSGNVRTPDAYGRDKLFMPARNAAKKSINRRQVLKLLSLAPFAPSIALKTTKMVGKRFPVKDREHLLALKEELEGFRQNLQDDNLMESPNYEDILSIQEKVDKLLVSKVVPKEIEFSSNFEAEFAHDAWDNVATFNENKNWPEPPEIFQKSSRPSEANFDNILASLADILQDSPLNDSIKAKIDKLTLDEILRLLEGKQVELKAESGIIPIQIESGKIEVISNRGTFDAGDPNMLYMPAATPEGVSPNTAREGDVVRLNEESLRLFMPANDKVRLEDYADRKMFALASDRLGIGRMLTGPKGKKKELTIDAQGGRGFMQIFNGGGWAFKGKQTADNFIKRVKDVAGGDDSVVVGITILSDLNHLHSAYGQLAYTNALRAAIESGTITEGMANRQIREIVKRIKQAKTKKPLPAESRKVVEAIKNFADFEKAVKAKKINFNLMAKVREKAEGKTLPLTATEAAKLELDVPSIAKDIADPELVGADFGKVVALLEVPVNQTPKKTDFHYSYPYTIEGHKIGFLEEFADVGELTSDPKVRTKQGRITAQPLQTVMPEFDRLRGNRFMPAKGK